MVDSQNRLISEDAPLYEMGERDDGHSYEFDTSVVEVGDSNEWTVNEISRETQLLIQSSSSRGKNEQVGVM